MARLKIATFNVEWLVLAFGLQWKVEAAIYEKYFADNGLVRQRHLRPSDHKPVRLSSSTVGPGGDHRLWTGEMTARCEESSG